MPRLHFLFVLHRLVIHRNRYIYHLHGYPRGNIFVRSGTQRDVSSWGNILFYHLLKWIRKLERMISLPQRMPKLQLYMWYYRSIFSDIYTLLYMTISYLLWHDHKLLISEYKLYQKVCQMILRIHKSLMRRLLRWKQSFGAGMTLMDKPGVNIHKNTNYWFIIIANARHNKETERKELQEGDNLSPQTDGSCARWICFWILKKKNINI